jgi:phenylalanyl-tRNA synthetase alpha subunit
VDDEGKAMVQRKNPAQQEKVIEQDQTAGNVDQIREILFGGQMRDYDHRFGQLERKMESEFARLSKDVGRQISALDTYVRKELEKLTTKHLQEKKDRTDGLKTLESGIARISEELDGRVSSLNDQMTVENREITEEMKKNRQELLSDMTDLIGEVTDLLHKESKELHELKVSRAEIAGLFSEVAMRLNKDFDLPD